jgi:hypothetical protein
MTNKRISIVKLTAILFLMLVLSLSLSACGDNSNKYFQLKVGTEYGKDMYVSKNNNTFSEGDIIYYSLRAGNTYKGTGPINITVQKNNNIIQIEHVQIKDNKIDRTINLINVTAPGEYTVLVKDNKDELSKANINVKPMEAKLKSGIIRPIKDMIGCLYFKKGDYVSFTKNYTNPNALINEKQFKQLQEVGASTLFAVDNNSIEEITRHINVSILKEDNAVALWQKSPGIKGSDDITWNLVKKEGKWLIKS